MNISIPFKQLVSCVWILEELQKSGNDGLSLTQLDELLRERSKNKEPFSRTTLSRRRKDIQQLFKVNIDCPDKKHYRIMNPEQLTLDTLANDLLASIQEYLFLDSYKDLGSLIQPMEIRNGMEFLHVIGDALRNKNKLKIRYQKFSDSEPYEAIVHPYCLKASMGRWYMIGFKENTLETEVHVFALDRTINLIAMSEIFVPSSWFDPETYFKDSFGVWVDLETYPVCDMTVAVKPYVASYFRTLPLHNSQKELSFQTPNGYIYFSFHISPTPDFIGELNRWGDDLKFV